MQLYVIDFKVIMHSYLFAYAWFCLNNSILLCWYMAMSQIQSGFALLVLLSCRRLVLSVSEAQRLPRGSLLFF